MALRGARGKEQMTRLAKILSATLALSLLGGAAATAQPAPRDFGRYGGTYDRTPGGQPGWDRNHDGRPDWDRDRDGRWDGRDRDGRWDGYRGGTRFGFGFGYGYPGRGYGPGYGYTPGYSYGPGYGYGYPGYGYHRPPLPRWHVGQRFYGSPYVVVGDWYRYHLRRPPYGYHWVRVNNDFLLIGITTGIIADLLLNHSYY